MRKNENDDANSGKKVRIPNAQVFTPMNAKQAQEASVRSRNLRKQMRAQLLEAAINDAKVGELYVKAFKSRDPELMKLVETGLKIVGLTHDQSEDAVQKVSVDSKNESKVTQTVRFTIAPKPEKNSEDKE